MQGMIHPSQTTNSLGIEQIIDWVLKRSDKYPGKHSQPTQRTNPFQKPLDAQAQVSSPQAFRNSFVQIRCSLCGGD